MQKIINYLNEVEFDYKKGIYTVSEYLDLKNKIEIIINKNNLNKY